ncbi:MAG: phage integrase SAM-like domain-containing protein [Muribaculaceae bacterium]|nr:phage integrase SAM-like domain-containing protein [Muribaculaceae bacterium]
MSTTVTVVCHKHKALRNNELPLILRVTKDRKRKFNHHLDIPFSEFDIAWLRRYESHLRAKGLAENTIGIRFRTLRSLYKVAIDENMVSLDLYPFKKYKVAKLHQEQSTFPMNVHISTMPQEADATFPNPHHHSD